MGLTYLFKKVLVKFYLLFKKASNKLHYWSIETNAGIRISSTCRIDHTAKIEIKYGGSISIGDHTEILEGVILQTYGGDIKIGSNCSLNPYSIIYGHGDISIGNNVLIAGGCMIIPSNHTFGDVSVPIKTQENVSKGIVIEDDVWLGHGCSILDGVTIGQGSVIAAGSVVNKSIDRFSVSAGVPAKLIRKRV
jgi:acetyltransferase-like isoleucine patch superfamily enzyme